MNAHPLTPTPLPHNAISTQKAMKIILKNQGEESHDGAGGQQWPEHHVPNSFSGYSSCGLGQGLNLSLE